MADTTASPATYNLFVKLLEGKTLNLKFTTPKITAASIKHRLHEITKIPLLHQRLLTGTRHQNTLRVGRNDSDTEEDDSDNEDEKEKSTLLDDGNSSGSNKEAEGSLDSVTGVKQDGESSGRGSCESGSEEQKEMNVHTVQESIQTEKICMVEPVVEDEKVDASASIPCSAPDTVLGVEAMQDEKMNCNGIEMQPQEISKSGDGQGVESTLIVSEVNGSSESSPVVQEETVANGNTAEMEKPVKFDEFNSAAEMEVLGPERLKSELQAHGLKCGGTLRERAARLFMLKSTPIENIPKKLLAKK